MKERTQEKNIRYKVFAMRLNEKTKKTLTEDKKKSGKSWNLFIYSLLKKNEKPNPTKSR